MIYSIRKLRAFAAMMIAAMIISIAVPQGVANAAPIDINSFIKSYPRGYSINLTWDEWTDLGGTEKVKIFLYKKDSPQSSSEELVRTDLVDPLPKTYTTPELDLATYRIVVIGVDGDGKSTTNAASRAAYLDMPYPYLTSISKDRSNSRSFSVEGTAPNCTDCKLTLSFKSTTSNSYVQTVEVSPEEWTLEGKFTKSLTLRVGLFDDIYEIYPMIQSTIDSSKFSIFTKSNALPYIYDTTPPPVVTNLEAVDNNDELSVTWIEPTDNDLSYTEISIKKPGLAQYDDPIKIPVRSAGDNAQREHKFTDLLAGVHEVKVVTFDSAGNASAAAVLNHTIDIPPPPVTGLELQDPGSPTDTMAALHWTGPNVDFDHFRVYFKKDGVEYDPNSYTVIPKPSSVGPNIFEFGVAPGKYDAKVVTVDAKDRESIPQEIAIDFTGKSFPTLQLSGETVYRNTNQYSVNGTVKGTTNVVDHYFTELRIYYAKNDVEQGFVLAEWDKNNNQFSATITFPDEETYSLRAFLTDPDTGYKETTFDSPITVEYDATLPNLPSNIGVAVQDNDIFVNWDAEAPNEQVWLTLVNKNNTSDYVEVKVPKDSKDIKQYVFEDLLPGTYIVVLDVENADGKFAQPYRSNELVIEVPVPVLKGPTEVKTNSPEFTVNGTASFCTGCKVFVTVRDTEGNAVEPLIEAANWSSTDDTFSVTSGMNRPFDVYAVSTHTEFMDMISHSKSNPSNPITFVYAPTPVLNGPAFVNSSSGIFTISGTAENCQGCEVIVSVYDQQGSPLEDITATNWSSVDNKFSVTVDRPNGTYKAKAAVKLKGYTGLASNGKTIQVAKSTGGGSGGGTGSGSGPVVSAPIKDPVIAPAPDQGETTFYLTPDASEHDGFRRSIRLSVDTLTVNQDTPVEVRRLPASSLSLPNGYRAGSDAFKLSSDKALGKALRLTLQYNSAPMNGVNPEQLGIYRQSDTDKNAWVYVGGIVNKGNNSIETTIEGTGTYAVLLFDKAFEDLNDHWAKNDISTLVSRHILNGVSAQLFEPERSITRAEAVKLLVEAIQRSGMGKLTNSPAATSFNDVSSTAWYHDAVTKASGFGIVNGDSSGAFRPEDPITREEFAAMIFRITEAGATEATTLPEFNDASNISDWAKQAIAFATQHGILQGMSDGSLQPQGQTTRAQAAAIVLRTMKLWGIVSSDDPATSASLDVTIYDAAGKAIGWAVLTQQQDAVRLQLKATGLKPGKHGFHIHEKAFTWLDFKSAGGHFNPDAKQHGHDNPNGHHQGDMPNLVADKDGIASVDMVLKGASLTASAPGSLIGRSIIIHAAEDDYKTDPAGNAGDRIAGGIIAE